MTSEGSDSRLEKEPQKPNNNDLFWVIVFNNEFNTFEEVITIIQKAISCSLELAEHIAWEIHDKGKAKVMIAPYHTAEEAAEVISSIGIKVSVKKAAAANS